MNHKELETFCMSLKGTTTDVKWETNLCYLVGDKMYAVTGTELPFTVSFKVLPEQFAILTGREGIIPAPYLARNNWVLIKKPDALEPKEWEYFLEQSYELIFSKLKKSQKKEILGDKKND